MKANRDYNYAKRQVQNEKIKNKLNSETRKSRRRQQLETEYTKKGFSEEEAAIAAYKRARTEKTLAIAAGMTLAAATAYVAYKHYDKTVDKIIKSGAELQNMSNNDNKGVSDAFYFSMTKSDNTKYRGMYGKTLSEKGKVYETKIGVGKNIKVASEKSAVNALSELVRDNKDYAKKLEEHLTYSQLRYPTEKQRKAIEKGLNSLKKGNVDANVYKALNLTLTDHNLPTSSEIHKGFYDKLKTKGYSAILDVNDREFSGFQSRKPMIGFDLGDKATVKKVREVQNSEIANDAIKAMTGMALKNYTAAGAAYLSALGLASNVAKKRGEANDEKIVQEYRKKHKNSKLSNTEILNNYYNY